MERKLEIFGKASLNREQIQDKIDKGCTKLELHLDKKWEVNGVPQTIEQVCPEWRELIGMIDIRVVHIPMVQENIEFLIGPVRSKILRETCRLAQACAENWGHKVLVAAHTESNFELLEVQEGFLPDLKDKVLSILDDYPLVELGIENVSPIQVVKGDLRLRGGIIDDNSRMVEYFNDPRIGTVFDTCHAKLTEMYVAALNQYNVFERYNFQSIAALHKDNAKLIHLATFEGNGYGKGHGLAIKDKLEMMEFVRMYKSLGMTCPITLEVAEDNYLDSQSYLTTRRLLEECWTELGGELLEKRVA